MKLTTKEIDVVRLALIHRERTVKELLSITQAGDMEGTKQTYTEELQMLGVLRQVFLDAWLHSFMGEIK